MTAPYQRLAAELRRRLADGQPLPGERFPSATELTTRHRVTRGAAQRAVGLLRQKGLLEGRRGARLVVAYRPAVRTLVDPDAPWPHGTGDHERGTCRAGPELQQRLQVPARARLRWSRFELLDPDGRPALLLTAWQQGAVEHDYDTAVCELRPHAMTPEEAALLGLASGTPALLVERTRLAGGRPVQTADLVLPADRWHVRV
jgi:GntR family transcriptional regulator